MKQELLDIRCAKFTKYYHAYFGGPFPLKLDDPKNNDILRNFVDRIPEGRMEELVGDVARMMVNQNINTRTKTKPKIAEFEYCLDKLVFREGPKEGKRDWHDKHADIMNEIEQAKKDGRIKDPGKCPDCGSKLMYFAGKGVTDGTHRCVNMPCEFKGIKNDSSH